MKTSVHIGTVFFNCKQALLILIICCLPLLANAQSENDDLSLFFVEEGQELKLFANNYQLYPLSLTFEFQLKGLKLVDKLPEVLVLPAEADTFQLATFSIPERRSWSYRYSYGYYSGDANAVHADDYVYTLPFKEGQTFLLSQGYFGEESHMNENALDFTMPEGTEICAARGGKVVEIKEDSNKGCPNSSCNEMGNYVRVLHDDGTLADYFHLQQNGALVEPGQIVNAGDVIALAGDTGWASGSHLHFIVFKASADGRMSFPTLFKTRDAVNGKYLKEDRRFTAIR